MPKFQKMNKISYREEDEIVNSPQSCTSSGCTSYSISRDGVIDIKRWKRDTGIQYRHEKKEDITGFIPKPIARPEYGTVYQHQGMLLQNLHCRYLYIVIQLPYLKDLDQKIPSFPNCDNYGIFSRFIRAFLTLGGPSIPHRLTSPSHVPLQPLDTFMPSKDITNCFPSFAFS